MKVKKIFSKILCGILCLSTVFSVAGCGSSSDTPSSSSETEQTSTLLGKKYTYEGTHIFTAPEADTYIVENGRTEYKILLSAEANMYELKAASELTAFFKQATNITLQTVTEPAEGIEHNDNAKYFSIGDTKMYQSSGLTYDAEQLGADGVRIQTEGNTVYLNGGWIGGPVYAVYDMLELLLNYQYFNKDCWLIDENVKNLKLRDFDVLDIPDVKLRTAFWGATRKNVDDAAYRFRMLEYMDAYLMPIGDLEYSTARTIHNSFNVFPKSAPTSETKWYSTAGNQLCYTARGDAESYERMVAQAAKVVESCLIKNVDNPNYQFGMISQQDGSVQPCACSGCNEARAKYGEDVGAVIVFLKDVMEQVTTWWDQPENAMYKREGFRLTFFAYNQFKMAPVYYDEATDSYLPNHPDLVMNEYTGAFYTAQTFEANVPLYDERNDEARENLVKWRTITDKLYGWFYSILYNEHLKHHVGPVMWNEEMFQLIASQNFDMIAIQGSGDSETSAFLDLKLYLESELSWNCNQDSSVLIENWFNAMYREAAPVMKALYQEEVRVGTIASIGNLAGLEEQNGAATKELYPVRLLNSWFDMLDEAQRIVKEQYASGNPTLYAQLKTRIDRQWVAPCYFFLKLYDKSTVGEDAIREKIDYFMENISPLGEFTANDKGATVLKTVQDAEGKL